MKFYFFRQGNERFFATFAIRLLRNFCELKAEKNLDDGVKGAGLDNKKYYKIDYERLGEIVEKSVFDKACDKGKNTLNDKGKNTLNDKGKNTLNARGKNTLNKTDKNTLHDKGKNTLNLPILQNQKITKPKDYKTKRNNF